MKIQYKNGKLEIVPDKSIAYDFRMLPGKNGFNYVPMQDCVSDCINISEGNDKTGKKVICFNFSIELTCAHSIECYKEKKCYACGGCYAFPENQKKYTENVNFFRTQDDNTIINAIQKAIDFYGYKKFRYFTCGDVPNIRFIDIANKIAIRNPQVEFWFYTKKYEIVNRWIDLNGYPFHNLVIIFSHWLNEDGTYVPMNNRHNLPTSEFIPYGKEELLNDVDYICPCSDPSMLATCDDCQHPCYRLRLGQKQALCEHSTPETKTRDKEIKQAHNAIKAQRKAKK